MFSSYFLVVEPLKDEKRAEVFGLNIKDWLLVNLSKPDYFTRSLGDWDVLFSVGCCSLWKRRNTRIFNPDAASNDTLLDYCYISWSPPPLSVWKVNVDGICKPGRFLATAGVIRDLNGKWLWGFGRNIGVCNAYEAEVLGSLIRLGSVEADTKSLN
ncbi:uncharacterized protein LOC105797521 [Gossypium raimondii]|uniref:uncharacterized protein LOC105797521 n=1 Tax=Gossypium raimondii TaxID=29730 RepID=UPI00063A9603|nr:uncharacterized protein LOC105797521 [Gossypium raimondii]